MLTLASVAEEPGLATYWIDIPGGKQVLFRPLAPSDVDRLGEFLQSLSPATRRFWSIGSFDRDQAVQLCDAINRYDKFRMIALTDEAPDRPVLAMIEIAFWTGSEQTRFRSYGIELVEAETCRFGPCVRDSHQKIGLGSALMPAVLDIVRRFGMRNLVLWGGVLQENSAAIHFYEKHGFQHVGEFEESPGVGCYDMVLEQGA